MVVNPVNLDEIVLFRSGHSPDQPEKCFNEWATYIAGEPHSASPHCVDPVISQIAMRLNDRWSDEDRQKLKPYLLKVLGTRADKETERRRAYMALDWSARVAMPLWLRTAGLEADARLLEALAPVVDNASASAAASTLRDVRDRTWSARRAAWDGLRETVREKVRQHLSSAASAAIAASAASADIKYGSPTYWQIRNAVYDAVKARVYGELETKYRDTVVAIQQSALELLDRLIDVEPVNASR